MTWSSSDVGTETDGSGGFPVNWTWQDLAADARSDAAQAGPSSQRLEALREEEKEEAYQRGYHEGVEAGRRQALKEVGPNLEASVQVVKEMEEFRDLLVEQLQDNVTALALAVARRLLDREVEADPEVVEELVRNALSHFPLDSAVRIRLNPHDLSAISQEGPEDRSPVAAGREVRWIPDDTLARGGCVVEGPERIVDGRVETALERIYRKVSHG